MTTMIDELNEFVHEKYIPKKKERAKLSKEKRNANLLIALIVAWIFGGAALILTLVFNFSAWFLLLGLVWVPGISFIYNFGCWYDEKHELNA